MQRGKFTFNIDRGGTFTDFYVQEHDESGKTIKEHVFKEPSVRQGKEGPVEGIRKFLDKHIGNSANTKIPAAHIERINLGTTLATNALLEKKGHRNAVLFTQGFEDLLKIKNQTRPDIFDLQCALPEPLHTETFGVDERVYLHEHPSSEKVQTDKYSLYVKHPDVEQLKKIAEQIREKGITSVAIAFANSYLYPDNQLFVKDFLLKEGFETVYLSCQNRSIGYLGRAETCGLEAFLSPFLDEYFVRFGKEFDSPPSLRVMKSDGGFANDRIRASNALLSGPAGGLIGYSKLIPTIERFPSAGKVTTVIGLDMGGTSTDVSKFSGEEFEHTYNFSINGIEINTPHLQIDTIAAGGGSQLTFVNGLFQVGPESVGSDPGPVCYGIGDQLAITDANIVLNRLDLDNFPRVFGRSRKEPVNPVLSRAAFDRLAEAINKQVQNKKSVEDIALGFVEMSNEMMARSVRKLYSTGKPEVLIVFGSAGGQHACGIAEKIGVDKVFIHKYSGVLSAYGLSKSDIVEQRKLYLGTKVEHQQKDNSFEALNQSLAPLFRKMEMEIFEGVGPIKEKPTSKTLELGVKYEGTSYPILVKFSGDFIREFETKHHNEFGFSMKDKNYTVEFCRLRISFSLEKVEEPWETVSLEDAKKFLRRTDHVFFDRGRLETPFYTLSGMKNCEIQGPSVLVAPTFSILVCPGWNAQIINEDVLLVRDVNFKKYEQKEHDICDPIKLSLYSSRFMSIAQEMGKALQKTSISTNIKERLDFSCAIFDGEGNLIANAPHLPVHLGSMQTTVASQIAHGIEDDEVIMTNHPGWGGSHLPDITVVSPAKIGDMKFYLAARGHHADIGGITPGSMPAFSKYLSQEGAAVGKFQLVKNGNINEAELREILKKSRIIEDNICDLKAQIAANEIGCRLLTSLVRENGSKEVSDYMVHIRNNAEEAVRRMLVEFSLKNHMKEVETVGEEEYMDDGTRIKLRLTIDRVNRSAIFDFTGTGSEVYGNTNAPESITRSAIIYSLRSLIKSEIPLNSGCLRPVTIIIPPKSILSPSLTSAVVGGNVETSQRLVDVILKPFKFVAASQGTMNNFLFGNEKLTYYETIAGGSGAGEGFNGRSCQCHMTNTRITDLEVLEARYPVCLEQFRIRQGSGGKGMFQGGNGIVRQFLFFEPIHVSILSERRVFAPYGMEGGSSGERGMNILIQDGTTRSMGSKSEALLSKFDRVVVMTPGGGGYGPCGS